MNWQDEDMEAWSRWVDGDPPPPSWAMLLEFGLVSALVLGVMSDLWLPALDQSMAWLGGGR